MERQFTREFHIDETHRFIDEENFAIRKTSAGRGWRLTFMSVQEEGPYERSFPAGRNVLICVVNYGYMRGTLIAGGQKYILDGGPGTVIIIPDGVAFHVSLESVIGNTHLYLRRRLFDEVAKTIFEEGEQLSSIGLCPGNYDPAVEQLCSAVRRALDDPSLQLAYVRYVVNAIAAMVLTNYGARGSDTQPVSGRLSQSQLRQIRDYINANLSHRLSLPQLSEQFGLSADHIGRLFKQSAGMKLYQFILRCRIDRARSLLTETSMPIAEIAQECGFADQVHLTRAFRRFVATTPAAYRKSRLIS